MLFNSLPFLVFLPIVIGTFFIVPQRWRWVWLLIASYFFYGFWKVEYLGLILTSTVVDFFAARFIYNTENQSKKKIGLAISLLTNLGMLAFFKYSGWFMEDVLAPLNLVEENQLNTFHSFWQFVLPVGISFYTFQTLGYTIDVYFGKVKPEQNPLKFALFVSFFPQLVAGPIERFSNLHHQLFKSKRFLYSNFQHGGRLILYGLFIKMCVADNLSPVVDQIFKSSEDASSLQLMTGAVLFGFQIYSDFHGYSLIAIGTARLLGIHLMDNFNAPYTATSIRSFWTKWHISLSTWFRDYLYLPLGGSRANYFRFSINILIVFLVSGLWHGANWTFVVWGAIHGVIYLAERTIGIEKSPTWLHTPRWLLTMIVVFVAWIFFRSESISDATYYILSMTTGGGGGIELEWSSMNTALLGLFILSDLHFRDRSIHLWLLTKPMYLRWTVYALLILCIMAYGGTVHHPFIYFQF